MLKKLLLLLVMVCMLSACGPTVYDQQAQMDAQRTYQNQYASQSACFTAFPYPGDCYMGAGGIWYSPLYYSWGAVIHYNHVVGYGLHVPLGGGVYVRPAYRVSVNYGYARTYISQRSTFYHNNTTYNASTRSFTPRATVSSTPYRSSGSAVPSRPTVTAPSRGSSISSFSQPRPASVSRINWGSSSGSSSRSSSSSSSYRSSGSSYRSSGSSSGSRSSSSSSSGRRR